MVTLIVKKNSQKRSSVIFFGPNESLSISFQEITFSGQPKYTTCIACPTCRSYESITTDSIKSASHPNMSCRKWQNYILLYKISLKFSNLNNYPIYFPKTFIDSKCQFNLVNAVIRIKLN